ncbi:FxLD family lanthipeptide [Streptomyces sp. 8N616]|uniref:FxLD family lanthipeptide n=1 Tax=Streptomyces sp. 8N616 TaxID=3457414 RepID=UPI003FD3A1A3
MTNTMALAERPAVDEDEDFAPLDVRVVVAAHPHGKLMCSTGDGCGQTCATGASACSSFTEDPA